VADHRDPANCKYFALCEPLKTLIGQLSLKLLDTYSGILPKEAESVGSYPSIKVILSSGVAISGARLS
jgi:hypothetical protein